MTMLKTTLLAAATALGLGAPPRAQEHEAARGHRLPLLVRGAVRPLRPGAAAARAAGLYRGLLGLPRAEVRDLPRARRARRPVDDRGADAGLCRDARRDDPDTGESRPATPSDHFQHSPVRERAGPQPDGQGARRLPRARRGFWSTSSSTASAGPSISPRCCSASPATSRPSPAPRSTRTRSSRAG